jgi:thiol:disulfide interchange protein DsbC
MNRYAKRYLGRGAAVLLVLTMATACAETPQEAQVKKQIEANMGEGAKVDAVTKTRYSGLYEVQSGGNIFYTDAKGEYVFAGQIFDAKTRKSLTKERLEEINKVKFSDLSLDLSFKRVKGDGKRVIAVFSDPNCGYCKRLEQNMKELDNVTVYTFMFNILSEESAKISKDVWCSADKNAAWENWMLNGKAAPAAAKDCTDPGEKVYQLGKKLRVDGTPTIFFADGSRISGAIDAKAFEEKFATLK